VFEVGSVRDHVLGFKGVNGKGEIIKSGGEKGVTAVLQKMKNEIERDMILMGCKNITQLYRSKIIYR
jgi:hypothetical protein